MLGVYADLSMIMPNLEFEKMNLDDIYYFYMHAMNRRIENMISIQPTKEQQLQYQYYHS